MQAWTVQWGAGAMHRRRHGSGWPDACAYSSAEGLGSGPAPLAAGTTEQPAGPGQGGGQEGPGGGSGHESGSVAGELKRPAACRT